MSHLSRDELLDAVESGRDVPAGHHAASCPACQAEIASLRAVLDDARAVDVPEPSPLFWAHLSARVRDAVAAEGTPARDVPRARPGLRWVLAMGSVAALAVAALVVVGRPSNPAPPGGTEPAIATAGPEISATADNDETGAAGDVTAGAAGEDWELVADLAESAEYDDVQSALDAGAPGAAESVVPTLTDEEQAELVRLIRAELQKGRPS